MSRSFVRFEVPAVAVWLDWCVYQHVKIDQLYLVKVLSGALTFCTFDVGSPRGPMRVPPMCESTEQR